MGAGMDKVLPGLYVGSIRDSKDPEQIKKHNITHILSIYEDAKKGNIENIEYLCFQASDHASQDIKKHFEEAIEFIHNARLNNGNVLVHCLAGISRSTTLVVSYIMAITELPWYDSLNAVRAARKGANPNFGFQRQLQNFEFTTIKSVRESLFVKFGEYNNKNDLIHCQTLLEAYKSQHCMLSISNSSSNNTAATTSSIQMGFNSVKTYPLGFNAYGLDKEDKKPKMKSDDKETDKTKNDESEIKEDDLSPPVSADEKEQIVDKIFK